WYSLRIRPYRTLENKIDGATVTFFDIDGVKRGQEAEAFNETVRTPVLVLDSGLRVKSANRHFYRYFALNESDVSNRSIFEVANGQWNLPQLRELLENVLPKKSSVEDFRIEAALSNDGHRTFLLNARRLHPDGPGDGQIILA